MAEIHCVLSRIRVVLLSSGSNTFIECWSDVLQYILNQGPAEECEVQDDETDEPKSEDDYRSDK